MRYFLNNPMSSLMLMFLLVGAGVAGFLRMPLSLMPSTSLPVLSVRIEYTGASPRAVERILTRSVERSLSSVPGVKSWQSVSEEGKSRTIIHFHRGTDMMAATLALWEELHRLEDSFPDEAQKPVVLRHDPTGSPVLVARISLKGFSPRQIRTVAEKELKTSLLRISGVSEVHIAGGAIEEVHVITDPRRMASQGISGHQLSSAVARNHLSVPLGITEEVTLNRRVVMRHYFDTTDEMNELPLLQGDRLVRAGDIARVALMDRDERELARLNGSDEVLLYVHKSSEAGTPQVCGDVREALRASPFESAVLLDQSELVHEALSQVTGAGMAGIIIVIILVFLVMRSFPSVMALSAAVPVSIVITGSLLWAFGQELNVMVLCGLALSAGMVVDSGILVVHRWYHSEDLKQRDQAVSALVPALLASLLTTVIVFLPLLLLPSLKVRFGAIALALSLGLLGSLLTALLLVPALLQFSDRFASLSITGNFVSTRITDAGTIISDGYFNLLSKALRHRKGWLLVTAFLFLVALLLLPALRGDEGMSLTLNRLTVQCEFPTGTSLEATARGAGVAEEFLREKNEVRYVTSRIEPWHATLHLTMHAPFASKRSMRTYGSDIEKELTLLLRRFDGFAVVSGGDDSSESEITLHCRGDEREVLRATVDSMAPQLGALSCVDDIIYRFRDGVEEYQCRVDRPAAAKTGITASSLVSHFRSLLYGPVIMKMYRHGRETDVRMKADERVVRSLPEILAMPLVTPTGAALPAGDLVQVERKIVPTRIWRINGRRSLSLSVRTTGCSTEGTLDEIESVLSRAALPEGVSFSYDESLREARQARRWMILAVCFALLFVYMVLAGLFESFRLPLVVMVSVPASLGAIIYFLTITGMPVSLPVIMGSLMVVGIVVNNGIVLVDALRSSDNMYQTALHHLSPLGISSASTVLGMIPMALTAGQGAALWRPMATVIIVGITAGAILTMVIVPVLYSLLEDTTEDVI